MTDGQGTGVGKKIGIGCGGTLVLLFLMGACVNALAGDGEDEARSTVTSTVTATVTETAEPTEASAQPTPAAVTETVEVTETVTQEVAVTEEVTVTETVTAEIQGFADIPPPPPTSAPPAGPVVPPGGYANCTEAWAAGAAPVYAGDPGYSGRLDRDGDGVGCEDPPR